MEYSHPATAATPSAVVPVKIGVLELAFQALL